jgi:hypothetical protein
MGLPCSKSDHCVTNAGLLQWQYRLSIRDVLESLGKNQCLGNKASIILPYPSKFLSAAPQKFFAASHMTPVGKAIRQFFFKASRQNSLPRGLGEGCDGKAGQ